MSAAFDKLHPRVLGALVGQSFQVWDHKDLKGVIRSPHDFQVTLGVEAGRIAKTLLLGRRGRRKATTCPCDFAGATLGSNSRINFRVLARMLEWKGCELASEAECSALADYPRWGMSPLGLTVRILFDEALLHHETIWIGGGRVGVEVELSPRVLAELTAAECAALSDATD
jgi:Cys-tRNA(Pro)/Cys-tRNA(Cys) deacylase